MSIKFYTSLHYSQFCKRAAARQYVVPGGVDVIPDGTIVNAHERGFGVFDSDGRFVAASAQMRGRRHQFVPSVPEKVPYLDMDVVYFGNVYPHFGHFLLEHMNRAWCVLRDEMRELPIVLVNNQNINPVPKYIYDLLDCLGIARDNIIILNETARFRNVYIPHQAFNIPFYWTDDFVKAYEYMASRTTGYSYEKIYVSRAKLSHGKTYGEEKIQQIFADNGFHIIYPETLSLREQISFMKNCRVLAGCAGTALHLGLFMRGGGTVIQIKRNRKTKDSFDVQNMINSAKGHNGIYIAASVEPVRTQHSTNMPQIIGLTKHLRKFFDENGFKYDSSLVAPDALDKDAYATAMAQFRATSSSPFVYNVKKLIIKLVACFIPGRVRRGRVRQRMKRWLTHN